MNNSLKDKKTLNLSVDVSWTYINLKVNCSIFGSKKSEIQNIKLNLCQIV